MSFREYLDEADPFKPLLKYIVKKNGSKVGKVIISINHEHADEVDKIIKGDKTLDKMLNSKDSIGKTKDYYFDVK